MTILGTSSETSYLTSTGLDVGIPLLTSVYTIPVKNITFRDVDTAIYINDNGTANQQVAIDWLGVNFFNVPNIGEIENADNFIFQVGAFLNSQNLKFTGTIGTIGITNSLLIGTGVVGDIIKILDTCVITRRFRITYSSIVAFSNTIGINVDINATIPTESYILDTVDFSGNGDYLNGVLVNSNKTLFNNCNGIINTSVNGQLYMRNNSIETIINNTTDFVKVAGITIPSTNNEKYTHSNNRLINEADIQRKFLVTTTLSFQSGNNNVIEFGFFDSKLNDIRIASITKSTANSSGRAESISMQCIVQHNIGNYIEVWARNTSSTQNIIVTELNTIIIESK